MTTTNPDWLASAISGHARRAMPIMTYPGLDLTGGSVGGAVTRAADQFACLAALADRFPSLAILTIMDLSVEAEAFGCPVRFSDDEVPSVTAPILDGNYDPDKIKVPAVGDARTAVYLETVALASAQLSGRPVLGGLIGPISLAVRLRDMTELMIDLMLNPAAVEALLTQITDFLIDYARAFKAAGADGIVMAEPAAGLLSPDQCEQFSSAFIRRIADAVQDDHFSLILHNCGHTTNLVGSMLGTGARGFHFGNAVDLAAILPQVPAHIPVFGNIDPSGVFRSGTPEAVHAATLALLRRTASFPNHILSSGCDIPPGTPVANIDAFFKALVDHGSEADSVGTQHG